MSNHLTDRGVTLLAEATHLGGLEKLGLSGNSIGHAAAAKLAQATFVGRLRDLSLIACNLDDQSLAVLLAAALPSLTDLSVGYNSMGDQAGRSLAGNRSLTRLKSLSIVQCGIGSETAKLLGRVVLPGLRHLLAARNPLGPEGVQALLDGLLLAPVSHLDLVGCALTDAGAEVVARSPILRNVRWLELGGNHISDQGAMRLAESPHLAGVQILKLSENKIGPIAREALTQRFGERVCV
jgi:hypothetical protein